jgi:hypothetical protein
VAITLTAFDPENDPLTYTVAAQPAHGLLTGTPPDLTYRPNANYYGDDSFTFKVNDGAIDSNSAAVSIEVTPVNDAPIANNQSVTVSAEVPQSVLLTSADVDGDSLSYSVVTQPVHGALGGVEPDLTYTAQAGYAGQDSFTFKVNDGSVDSNTATVSITVQRTGHVAVCDAATAQPRVVVWSPQHKMETIAIAGVTDPDGDPVAITVSGIMQDEPVNDKGEGNFSPDAILAPVSIRAERSGKGDGRVYHIGFSATDNRDGTCSGSVTVCVPHDQSGTTCTDGGPLYDSTQR